jgi:hypothetical protein
MIRVTELHSGFYVDTTTNSPAMQIEAVQLLPRQHHERRIDAENAAQAAECWADIGRWTISAIDRATGERFDCFTWRGLPSNGIRRAQADAKEFGRDCYAFQARAFY